MDYQWHILLFSPLYDCVLYKHHLIMRLSLLFSALFATLGNPHHSYNEPPIPQLSYLRATQHLRPHQAAEAAGVTACLSVKKWRYWNEV
jgi:hypothetical protein